MADPDPQPNATTPQVTPPAAGLDPEIAAITKVSEALATLEPAMQQRVLRWAADKYNVALVQQGRKPANSANQNQQQQEEEQEQETPSTFTDFASLYEAAKPRTDVDRALLAGYWLQVVQGNNDWDGFSANKELKNLGHGTTNITRQLEQLINQKPQLVMQTRKSGTTRQAKKKYKVTGEGIKRVKRMLAGTVTEEAENGGQE